MKIKHWQGYGTVNAVKVKSREFDLVVKVSGNHEWGLRRDDMFDVFNWLVKRFDKSWADKTYADFRGAQMFIQHWDYEGVEYCQYSFRYRRNF